MIRDNTAQHRVTVALRRANFRLRIFVVPNRSRLFSADFILDVIEAEYEATVFYYMVHRRSSGEILTMGQENSREDAERQAIWSLQQLTGILVDFGSADSAAAS